ncbi:hypothetical protein HDV03_002676 [Kappamyces sp. JEL0829]|nr:hypothetical protein HDV03_002676 [Kappamyces sp. JEL0829]
MSNAVKVSFIGGGNMANAIIGGLIAAGYSSSGMVVSDPYEPTRLGLEKNYGVKTTVDNNETITSEGTVLILAVKPQVMKTVAQGIAAAVQKYSPLVITIAAGITVSDLTKWLTTGSSAKAASIVGEGATGVYATDNVTPAQRTTAFSVLQSISKSIYWVDKESLIDVVTGVSGSGPAYFFLMVEALEAAGVELGLPLEVARGLASQTCVGAGKMLVTSSDTPAELRRKVTSPNGTTEAAVKSFERDEIRQIIARAVKAAADRGGELGKILGAQVRAVLSYHRQ